MSGGCFDYAFTHVNDFRDKLGDILDGLDNPGLVEPDVDFSWLTQQQRMDLLCLEQRLRGISEIMRQVEWVFSGDSTEWDRELLRDVCGGLPEVK